MDFLVEYGIFLAKTATVIGGLAFLFAAVFSAGQRLKKFEKQGHIEITSLSDKYRDMEDVLRANILSDTEYKAFCKQRKNEEKAKRKKEKKGIDVSVHKSRVFVVDFVGDIKASACASLSEVVTAILMQAGEGDEVVLRLESSGGMVHSYGLAASQLQRIRSQNIPLTVCVDKVAASGGYMMACIGSRLLAAPFALLGSIGVVAQIPNLNRLLKKHDIDYEMLTAGEYKRTLTVFGENTEKGRRKFQEEIEETHGLFKQFVQTSRPSLAIDTVATGEAWFGLKALEKGLVDAIQTSDEYLFLRHKDQMPIYKVEWIEKHSLAERFGVAAESCVDRMFFKWLSHIRDQDIFRH